MHLCPVFFIFRFYYIRLYMLIELITIQSSQPSWWFFDVSSSKNDNIIIVNKIQMILEFSKNTNHRFIRIKIIIFFFLRLQYAILKNSWLPAIFVWKFPFCEYMLNLFSFFFLHVLHQIKYNSKSVRAFSLSFQNRII